VPGPTDVLEHLSRGAELRVQQSKPAATPEEARTANAALRRRCGSGVTTSTPSSARQPAHCRRAVTRRRAVAGMLVSVVSHHGFAVRYVQTCAVGAIAHRPANGGSTSSRSRSRSLAARDRAAGPRPLPARSPGARDFADFLRQRVEANYFAAAVLMPERQRCRACHRKQSRDLAVEDLVDLFSVSYEMAATGSPTWHHHLDLHCHFVKNDAAASSISYEKTACCFRDASGAIEGSGCAAVSGRQVFGHRRFSRISSTRTRRRDLLLRRPGRSGPSAGSRSRSACRTAVRWFRGREVTTGGAQPARR